MGSSRDGREGQGSCRTINHNAPLGFLVVLVNRFLKRVRVSLDRRRKEERLHGVDDRPIVHIALGEVVEQLDSGIDDDVANSRRRIDSLVIVTDVNRRDHISFSRHVAHF